MAKGDHITVVIAAGDGATGRQVVTATKAGRKVRSTVRTRQKVAWLDVVELTRTNRETGTKLSVRLTAVVSILEERADDEPPRAKVSRKADTVTVPLGLDA